MDTVGETRLDIVEIVANEDDALSGKARAGNGAGQDFPLGAAAVGAKGMVFDRLPEAASGEAQLGRFEKIGGGDAEPDAAAQMGKQLRRAIDR